MLERHCDTQKKRKTTKQLSSNSHTKKTRTKIKKFTKLKKQVEYVKTTDKTTLIKVVKSFKTKTKYLNAFNVNKIKIIEKIKENVILQKYVFIYFVQK